jgi:hypothetical protein
VVIRAISPSLFEIWIKAVKNLSVNGFINQTPNSFVNVFFVDSQPGSFTPGYTVRDDGRQQEWSSHPSIRSKHNEEQSNFHLCGNIPVREFLRRPFARPPGRVRKSFLTMLRD